MTKLFSLLPGEKFIFNKQRFRVKKFKNEVKPLVGRTCIAVCKVLSTGKIAKFIRNWEVERT